MKFHPEELAFAEQNTRDLPFEELSDAQMKSILDRGRVLFKWHKSHPVYHVAIGMAVFAFLFGAEVANPPKH